MISSPRRLLAPSIVVFLALFVSAARADSGGWGSSTAQELTRQGREHVKNGHDELAARRFAEAVQIDPTYGPAYLELAAVRERSGDLREAERTYDVAIGRVPDFAGALRARAALLHRLGEGGREIADLEAAARLTDTPDVFRELAQGHVADGAWPAALATWRKIQALAEKVGDEQLAREANTQIRGLVVLCGELDPVASGTSSRDWVRRAEASVAKRRGM
ncbi:MAG TPA: tetratricopeptide repeat protein [Polyangiaceae bacterium]